MAENMKKREARIQKAGGVIGGVTALRPSCSHGRRRVFRCECKAHRNRRWSFPEGSGTGRLSHTRRSPAWRRDVFDKGKPYLGDGTGKISSGTFTNDEFGAYRLYLHNRVRCAVVVRHGADETTVFNGETEEKTKEVYEELASRAKT